MPAYLHLHGAPIVYLGKSPAFPDFGPAWVCRGGRSTIFFNPANARRPDELRCARAWDNTLVQGLPLAVASRWKENAYPTPILAGRFRAFRVASKGVCDLSPWMKRPLMLTGIGHDAAVT